jgi:5-methylthioadenosine/S-adenosylhomocysteine deaminase
MRRKARLSPAQTLDAARLGTLLSLRTGVTTVADCSFAGATVVAARECGLRAVVYIEAFGNARADATAVTNRLAARLDALESEAGPLTRLGISPHAPYTVAPHVYAALMELARARDLPVATHVAESAAELQALQDGSGPIGEALPDLPRLGEHPVARLTGTASSRRDGGHPRRRGRSRRDRGAGRLWGRRGALPPLERPARLRACPLRALQAAGVVVGLGSDSPSSAVDVDHFADLRAAVFAARAREADAGALSATTRCAWPPVEAARAIGLEGQVGALTPGLRADLTVVAMDETTYWPVDDPAAAVVYGGSPGRRPFDGHRRRRALP